MTETQAQSIGKERLKKLAQHYRLDQYGWKSVEVIFEENTWEAFCRLVMMIEGKTAGTPYITNQLIQQYGSGKTFEIVAEFKQIIKETEENK